MGREGWVGGKKGATGKASQVAMWIETKRGQIKERGGISE